VKPLSADGSVGSPHVRVGHRQASKSEKGHPNGDGPFFMPLDFRVFRDYNGGHNLDIIDHKACYFIY